MYVCMYVCMYVFIYLFMYVCMYVRTYVCMYVCTYVCMYVCVCVCVCVCKYVRMCMQVYVYNVCMQAYVYYLCIMQAFVYNLCVYYVGLCVSFMYVLCRPVYIIYVCIMQTYVYNICMRQQFFRRLLHREEVDCCENWNTVNAVSFPLDFYCQTQVRMDCTLYMYENAYRASHGVLTRRPFRCTRLEICPCRSGNLKCSNRQLNVAVERREVLAPLCCRLVVCPLHLNLPARARSPSGSWGVISSVHCR